MLYVGLDVHKSHITACVLDSNGKVKERWQVRDTDQMMKRLIKLPAFQACFEASTGYGGFYELLKTVACHVSVAHPGLLRLIFQSKKKNDRADALKLAKLLYIGEVPTVHVPTANVRAWRELIFFRKRLVEKRTRVKNSLRCLLRSLRISPPAGLGLWTKKGIAWLSSLEFEQSLHSVKRNMLIDELETHSKHIGEVERELAEFSKDNAAVTLLRTIPGVGLRTAEAVVAFIDDPHRFPNSKRLGSYFGLVPSQDQSGNTNRLGHITKEGCPVVRAMLTEAVWQAVRRSPTIRAFQERIQGKDPDRRKISVIATAHYLVRVMWSMLKNGTVWKESVALPAAA